MDIVVVAEQAHPGSWRLNSALLAFSQQPVVQLFLASEHVHRSGHSEGGREPILPHKEDDERLRGDSQARVVHALGRGQSAPPVMNNFFSLDVPLLGVALTRFLAADCVWWCPGVFDQC